MMMGRRRHVPIALSLTCTVSSRRGEERVLLAMAVFSGGWKYSGCTRRIGIIGLSSGTFSVPPALADSPISFSSGTRGSDEPTDSVHQGLGVKDECDISTTTSVFHAGVRGNKIPPLVPLQFMTVGIL